MKNKIRLMFYLFLTALFIGLITPFPNTQIDPELKPYHDEVMVYVKKYCKDDEYFNKHYKIEFQNFNDKKIAGYCLKRVNRFTIQISRYYWDNSTEEEKFSLIVHEDLHCLFGIMHVDDPNDIMYYSDSIINTKDVVIKQLINHLKKVCKQ